MKWQKERHIFHTQNASLNVNSSSVFFCSVTFDIICFFIYFFSIRQIIKVVDPTQLISESALSPDFENFNNLILKCSIEMIVLNMHIVACFFICCYDLYYNIVK